MLKLLLAVILAIAAAMVAGVYFGFNPVILIFGILGVGIYMVGRIGRPALPQGTPWGSGHGIYMSRRDFVDDDTSCGGKDPREGDGFR
jgi:hypothetical protein